jgi:hypothetical protein
MREKLLPAGCRLRAAAAGQPVAPQSSRAYRKPSVDYLLAKSYPTLPADTVVEVVNAMRDAFNGSRIREYVPLFIERRARAALTELAV